MLTYMGYKMKTLYYKNYSKSSLDKDFIISLSKRDIIAKEMFLNKKNLPVTSEKQC